MLYGILLAIFIVICLFLILFILIQGGKGSLPLESAGTQMLFGGSGGQDILQKITWWLGSFFMVLALVLSLMKMTHRSSHSSLSRAAQETSMPQS